MNARLAVLLIAAFAQLIVSLSLLALPNITHRDLLFGVPVPPGFRASEPARRMLRLYRLWIAIPGAASLC